MNSSTPLSLLSLDNPSSDFARQPFYDLTLALLRSVRDHDFATLASLCDDDFGIVDIDVAGTARPIRNRTEWEAWFTTLFATLRSMDATTDSIIRDYRALSQDSLGFGVLEFQQIVTVGSHVATFECVATIVWKLTADGWREARWHASVVSSDIPVELRLAA